MNKLLLIILEYREGTTQMLTSKSGGATAAKMSFSGPNFSDPVDSRVPTREVPFQALPLESNAGDDRCLSLCVSMIPVPLGFDR